jgi:molybdopterin-guanine dinucleotide biosynthesis protein A
MSAVTGVILAGGRGSRMGDVDKGLQPFRGRPLIQHVIARLRPQVDALVINANRNVDRYATLGYPVIADSDPGFVGPLAGFAAGMAAANTASVVTVPCDSPLLPGDLVARLATGRGDAEIAFAITGDQPQPVFCLLGTALLPSLREFLAAGERKIDLWFAQHRSVPIQFTDAHAFSNVNTLHELQALEAHPSP